MFVHVVIAAAFFVAAPFSTSRTKFVAAQTAFIEPFSVLTLIETGEREYSKVSYVLDSMNTANGNNTLFQLEVDALGVKQYFDGLTLERTACQRLNRIPPVAFIGPSQSLAFSDLIGEIAASKQVPHFATVQTRSSSVSSSSPKHSLFSIFMQPHVNTFVSAVSELIRRGQWESFVLLYDSDERLAYWSGLLTSLYLPHGVRYIRLERASDNNDDVDENDHKEQQNRASYRNVMMKWREHYSKFLVAMDEHEIPPFLTLLSEINMTTSMFTYHLLTPNFHMLRSSFSAQLVQSIQCNITAFTIVPFSSELAAETSYDTASALLYDSVQLLAAGIRQVVLNVELDGDENSVTSRPAVGPKLMLHGQRPTKVPRRTSQFSPPQSMDCYTSSGNNDDGGVTTTARTTAWPWGKQLLSSILKLSMMGMSGPISFDAAGHRTNFTLHLLELQRNGLEKVGEWHSRTGKLLIDRDKLEDRPPTLHPLAGQVFRVTTVLDAPFIVLRNQTNVVPSDGNNTDLANIDPEFETNFQFTGFCVEMLQELSERLGFKYKIHIVKDGKYGAPLDEAKLNWTGMIGEVMRGDVDTSIAPITITHEREQVIDFVPYLSLGISILYRKAEKPPPRWMSFLDPLSNDVWALIALAFIVVSLANMILARFSPREWVNPHPCRELPNIEQNQYAICNAMWFSIGALMQQSSDVEPRALSTRIVLTVWGFFAIIMLNSYTANFAAFLTYERSQVEIKSARDLAAQTEIKYGCFKGGATCRFFEQSNIELYQDMWNFMSSNPDNFAVDNSHGVEKVLTTPGKGYAFLMESAGLQYQVAQNCKLVQVGHELNSVGYGMMFRSGSPYRDIFSNELLRMQEDNTLYLLKLKWWQSQVQCEDTGGAPSTPALSFIKLSGIFVVLGAGMLVSVALAIIEFTYKFYKHSSREDRRRAWLISAMWRQLVIAVTGGSQQAALSRTLSRASKLSQMGGNGGGGGGGVWSGSNSAAASENGGIVALDKMRSATKAKRFVDDQYAEEGVAMQPHHHPHVVDGNRENRFVTNSKRQNPVWISAAAAQQHKGSTSTSSGREGEGEQSDDTLDSAGYEHRKKTSGSDTSAKTRRRSPTMELQLRKTPRAASLAANSDKNVIVNKRALFY